MLYVLKSPLKLDLRSSIFHIFQAFKYFHSLNNGLSFSIPYILCVWTFLSEMDAQISPVDFRGHAHHKPGPEHQHSLLRHEAVVREFF